MKKVYIVGILLLALIVLSMVMMATNNHKFSEITLENVEAIANGEGNGDGEEYWCLVTWQCTGIDTRFLSCAGKECSSGSFAGGYVECDGNRTTCRGY